MLPFGQNQSGGSLEDRLRGMILNNQATASSPAELQSPQVPPHLRGASLEDQARYFTTVEARSLSESASQPAATVQKQKRPNQAQRRQMTAQMSIPIDSRQAQNTNTSTGRSPGFNNYPSSPHFNSGNYNQRSHQPYSPRHQQPHPSARQSFPQSLPRQSPMHQQNFRATNHQEPPSQFGLSSSQSNFRSTQPHDATAHFNQSQRPVSNNRQLYQPGSSYARGRQSDGQGYQDVNAQAFYLEHLLHEVVPKVGMKGEEEVEKETFRSRIEKICQDTIATFELGSGNEQFAVSSVQLQCFGSMASGFATQASDMDLALLAPNCVPDPHSPESRIPRLLEKALLNNGYGARLLTRTRVPIIKLCERPTEKLLTDLREARVKWDHGVEEDVEGDNLNEGAHPGPGDVHVRHSSQEAALKDFDASVDLAQESHSVLTPVTPAFVDCSADVYNTKLSGLRQTNHQNLQDYHSSAKRLLRKLGGRDLTVNAPTLEDHETKILNDFCKAFIVGLEDKLLAERLQHHPSIAPLFDSDYQGKPRSLQGLWTQTEGERLATAFESRPFVEINERAEAEAGSAIESWAFLQTKPLDSHDAMMFNRQLFQSLERLKKINSLQIMFLEQMPFENPAAYFARTLKLQQGLRLRGHDIASSKAEVEVYVAKKYIAGINLHTARESITTETQRHYYQEHVRLQLIDDYEHALSLEIYKEEDAVIVNQYITNLKQYSTGEPHTADNLITKIKALPDPTQVSTLNPKDPYKDKLEFPKTDIGIQCDINFSAHLAIHNTLLLRCYSASDPRVKPMILFIKHWAKVRGINTAYRGTLSSYGYVLMVLHYLVNVAQPFVCPNLQLVNAEPPAHWSPAEREARSVCEGRDVRFWRNLPEIQRLSEQGMLNHNKDSLGYLLRGFFEYYAHNSMMSTSKHRGFDWGREVLSLRTQGGIVSKQDKGWTGAKTVVETTTIAAPSTPSKKEGDLPSTKTMEETKEIRYRYLFAIEDPFEHDHNVARTVTHNGIVSIRDEFRRAWRIIKNVGRDSKEGLLDPISDGEKKNGLKEALDIIHSHGAEVSKSV